MVITERLDGVVVSVRCAMPDDGRWLDEQVTLSFREPRPRLTDLSYGLALDRRSLHGFTATPIPFRVGLDGALKTLDLGQAEECSRYAEGWVVDNGQHGMLVMRLPSGSAYTCFAPLVIGPDSVQVGSIGPDGEDHRERNPFLDVEWEGSEIELPVTRFIFFEGDWRTGYGLFRETVRDSLSRRSEPRRRPCPVTYNTYHDFGPSYDKGRLLEIMPGLASMGFGMLHLDPGWETVWGSNIWNDQAMGDAAEFVLEAERHGLEVGCWTSVHTTDPEVHKGSYAIGQSGEQYFAEDFTFLNPAAERLWGVCLASAWRQTTLDRLSRLGRAGVRFLNSDFHDWPWSGEGCRSNEHLHSRPITRAQWAESLNGLYEDLHRACPDMVIELHDHVESGEYRTPAWYLYDRPFSYDEKWAYEFMWKTYEDLMERKLFALYHLRLAEPIPLYLHINASSDNENALAFWYVASCVTHIGVGAIMKAGDAQRNAYARAFEQYNARFDAFALGEFYGIDELTHVHVSLDRKSAVLLAFNLDDQPVERQVVVDPISWGLCRDRAEEVRRACGGADRLSVSIGARDVTLIDLPSSAPGCMS